jgi:hypothetical protein
MLKALAAVLVLVLAAAAGRAVVPATDPTG